MSGSNKELLKGTLWTFVMQIAYILVGLAGNIILARLLMPNEFGIVGIAMFFVGISNVLVESGMGGALIRKEMVSDADYSTMFLFNLAVSSFLFIISLIFAGYIADFYKTPLLRDVLAVLSLTLIINALTITQNVKLVREMKFKNIGVYKFVSLSLATVIAVTLGYLKYGVWAIVSLQIFYSFFLFLIFTIKEGRLKKIIFSKNSFKEMYSFGIFTTLTSLVITIFENIYQLVIGKYFAVSTAGFFYQSKRLQEVLDGPTKLVLYNVVYSHMSKLQNDQENFKKDHINILKWTAMGLSIITCSIFLYSDQIILILYGAKWLQSSFYLKLLTVASFFTVLEIVSGNLFRIFNKTKNMFYVESVKKVFQAFSIGIGVYFHSIEYLLYGLIITSIIGYLISYNKTRALIDTVTDQNRWIILKIVVVSTISTSIILICFYIFNLKQFEKLPLMLIFVFLQLLLFQLFELENIGRLFKTIKSLKQNFLAK